MTLEAVRPLGTGDERLVLTRAAGSAAALVAFAPVVGLAGAQGGYFPSAWGWATLPLLWATAIVLVVRRRIRLAPGERIFLVLLAALTAWIGLSAIWSEAPARSVLETQRALLYAAGVAAALVIARSRFASQVLGGTLAAVSAIGAFSLATRILPDRVGVFDPTAVYRLAQPIGYWNGLAVFTGMGALLALAFTARARTTLARSACAAMLVVLLPTLYFTFGRGAWIAVAAGLAAAVAVDPRRLQLLATLLVVGPAPALAVWLASRERGLTQPGASLARAVHDGHRLAAALLVLAAVNAAASATFAFLERHVDVSPVVRRGFAGALAITVVVGLAATFFHFGGPVTLLRKGYTAFKAPLPHVTGSLNSRLLSFSGNGRADLWRLAWEDARSHSVLGAGAGTYERYFLVHQPANVSRVRDAHGLYIETLAELGPVGLALLVAALLVPLTMVGPARRHPLVPGAVGAYVAYLVHTGVDWDWELPAVTLVGLLCAAAIMIAGRRSFRSPPLSLRLRWIGGAAIMIAAVFAAIGLVGNNALSRSESAREHKDWTRAASEARRARSWLPWSPQPWVALGRAELGAGLLPEARARFRKAISKDSGDWEFWYYLASASRGAARRAALRHAVRLFPRAQLLRAAANEKAGAGR